MRHRDDMTRDKALQKILTAGERAARISHGVLGMARNRADHFAATDLAALIDETLFLLERELTKYRIKVETRFARRATGAGDWQPDPAGAAEPVDQCPSGDAKRGRAARTSGPRSAHATGRSGGAGYRPGDSLPTLCRGFSSRSSAPSRARTRAVKVAPVWACPPAARSSKPIGGAFVWRVPLGRGTAFTIRLPVAAREALAPQIAPVMVSPMSTTAARC